MSRLRGPAGAVLLLAGGCAVPVNDAVGPLDADRLPALSAPDGESLIDGEPSLSGLDRRSWPPLVVRVPTRQVEHPPAYMRWISLPPDPRYPTAETALSSGARPYHVQVGQTFLQTAAVGVLLVQWPIGIAMGRWPWRNERSPALTYARAHEPGPMDIGRWVQRHAPPPPERPPPPDERPD